MRESLNTAVLHDLKLKPLQLAISSDSILGNPAWQCDQCRSTNDVVHQLAAHGAEEGALVRAHVQEAGRGRHGAPWFSSVDALQFSFLLRPKIVRDDLPFLNVLFAYAIMRTLYQKLRLPIMLKWPNDLMLKGKKLCGVMSESRSLTGGAPYIVVGCGLNLNVKPESFPPELRSQATSVVAESGQTVEPQGFLAEFLPLAAELYEAYFMLGS